MKSLVLGLLLSVFVLAGCDSTATGVVPIAVSAENGIYDEFVGDHTPWQEFAGRWLFTDGLVRQTSTRDYFPLILRMDRQYSDLDITVGFRPLSGRIDASGGVVFRAVDQDNYYVVRANSLEDNFRLYTFVNGDRSQIATAKVEPPALGMFHHIRVVAKGDRIQAYLNGTLLLDHHDQSYTKGYVGLWTKADSVTEFDHVQVVGVQ